MVDEKREVGFFRGLGGVIRGLFRAVRSVIRAVAKIATLPGRLRRRRAGKDAETSGDDLTDA